MNKLIFAALMVLASGALVFAGNTPSGQPPVEPDPPEVGGPVADPDDGSGDTHGSGQTGGVESGDPTHPTEPPPDKALQLGVVSDSSDPTDSSPTETGAGTHGDGNTSGNEDDDVPDEVDRVSPLPA